MKIAHLADLHLGYRAYHRVNSRGVNQREADVAEAFRRAIAKVVERRPDLVLVAGDVFHTVRPSNTAIAEAFRQFSVLSERLPETPVVMIAGNHDSPRSADTGNILSLFREIPGVRVVYEECRPVQLPEIETSVLCMPHVSLAVDHETVMEPDPAARHNILLLHGEITDKNGEPRYRSEFGGAQVPETAIKANRWTYVALGHHHEAESLARNSWYAGGIERTSAFIWQERRPKGFLIHDTATGDTEHVAVETREILDLPKIEAKGLSAAEVDEGIRTRVEKIEDGVRGKIIRLVVFDVPRQVVRELDHRRIREWKAEALHFHLDARPPQVRRRIASGAPVRRLTLREQVESWMDRWTPTREGVTKEKLKEMGGEYVERAAEGV
ncbi:MAG TPA: metallophosphoesterase [Longimicrobium sp.]|nr:metallophosphoesterase [Longimicrobium sp.]